MHSVDSLWSLGTRVPQALVPSSSVNIKIVFGFFSDDEYKFELLMKIYGNVVDRRMWRE